MNNSMEGKKVPQVTFHTRQGDKWVDVTTDDLFKGKKVVAFALPGAFTPTCSSAHLPRYNELYDEFKKLGVDDILCISVNDTFVMNAWQRDQHAEKITFVPDGNAELTDAMGMTVNYEDIGFGSKRTWRYSMFVNDGVIEKMFVEPEEGDDPFFVSDADHMLKYLNPQWSEKPSITIFTKPGCPFCTVARNLLDGKGLEYEEIVLGRDATMTSIRAITGKSTAPQVFIGGKYIGGSEDLEKYLAK